MIKKAHRMSQKQFNSDACNYFSEINSLKIEDIYDFLNQQIALGATHFSWNCWGDIAYDLTLYCYKVERETPEEQEQREAEEAKKFAANKLKAEKAAKEARKKQYLELKKEFE